MSCEHCEEEDKKEYREATWGEAAMIGLFGPPALLVIAVIVAIGVALCACAIPFMVLFGKMKVAK